MILVTVLIFHSLSHFVEQVNTPYEVISHILPVHWVILYARIFPTNMEKADSVKSKFG